MYGEVCQRWSSQKPHAHNFDPASYANKGIGDHSFCRNPNNRKGGPWCYTTNPSVEWQTCDIPICGEH